MSKAKPSELMWIIRRIRRYIPGIALVTALNAVNALTGVTLAFLSQNLLDSQDNNSKLLFGIVLLSVVIFNILIFYYIRYIIFIL